MSTAPIYRTPIAADWIDYNGHLRDAYYCVIISSAADALMDRIGIDEAYRHRTRCTLYTLEMHVHFLRELKQSDVVEVGVRLLGADAKRIHAAFDLTCQRFPEIASTAELMLLHVHQGEKPSSARFPTQVLSALEALRVATAPASHELSQLPGSRRIELRSRS